MVNGFAKTALLSTMVVFCVPRATPQSASQIKVRIVKVDRTASRNVEVTFTLTNAGRDTIFIPVIDVPGLREPWALELQHAGNRGEWGSLGPFNDVPTGTAERIAPQSTVLFKHSVADPCIVVWPGKLVPRHSITPTALSGKYKLRVGYYQNEAGWKERLSVLEGKSAMRQTQRLLQAESEAFTIPPLR